MDSWYLKDAAGGVVGPIGRDVVIELLRSRPGVFVSASADGVHFSPIRAPQLVPTEAPASKVQREAALERRAAEALTRFRTMEPHVLFGVPKDAGLKDHREGYYKIYARFREENLPPDASPSLRTAHRNICQYLKQVMAGVEKSLTPAAPAPAGAKTWKLEDLHLQQFQFGLRADIDITEQTAMIFSAHRLINLKNQGVFFPVVPTLSLGTRLEMIFHFRDARRDVKARGAVALESGQANNLSPLRGFGVRLDNLSTEDKGFMLRESARLGAR